MMIGLIPFFSLAQADVEVIFERHSTVKIEFHDGASLADLLFNVKLPKDIYWRTAQIANEWGDMQETFYDSACNNFNAAMKYIEKNQLLSQFETRIQHILKNSESSGYAFPDIMYQIYEEHNKMNT